ncbi:MAG: carbonic anhydrase [Oligoflexales bacterium]
MKKLVNGIIDFRKNIRPSYKETFARLALGQAPDVLFIGCSDSRVVPNLFASTDPGDLFVIRNVGNLVPPCGGEHGRSTADESEAAAIEFAVTNLSVQDVIVCGHSECGAMQALLKGREKVPMPNLRGWLRHGDKALQSLLKEEAFAEHLQTHNRLSQRNVLQQVEHLMSYPIIQDKIASKQLRIHAWWFELSGAAVHCFDPALGKFVEIDEKVASRILRSLEF